jgi:hypothetical protein
MTDKNTRIHPFTGDSPEHLWTQVKASPLLHQIQRREPLASVSVPVKEKHCERQN